jgi:hypothetical protein
MSGVGAMQPNTATRPRPAPTSCSVKRPGSCCNKGGARLALPYPLTAARQVRMATLSNAFRPTRP